MLPEDADVNADVLGNAFLASPYGSFILNWNGRILVCNRRAERSFCPFSPAGSGALTGTCFSELTLWDRDDVISSLRKGAASGSVSFPMAAGNFIAPLPDTEFRVSLLRSATKGERLILLTQDQLRLTADRLRQMNEMRGKLRGELSTAKDANAKLQETLLSMEAFAHAAAHDLRTPINTMTGSLQFFSEHYSAALPQTAREFLQHMARAARQMDQLTTELLEHSVSTASGTSFQEVVMADAVSEACDSLHQALQECGAKTRVRGADITLHADPTLLHLVLTNLLSNAIKYRDPARPLEITISMEGTGREQWALSVADNGTGFDPREKHRILQPFHRAHREIEGSGIGLSTCAEICRRHSWKLTADAEPGKGATFKISCG